MKKLFFSYLTIGLLIIVNITQAQEKNIEDQFPKDFKNKVFEHIINITNIGVHTTGTIEEKLAADYVLGEFDKINLETSVETFEFESFDITETKLKINQRKTEVLQACFNPYTTTKFDFDENFILLNPDNTTTDDISNKIVVASFPLENSNFFRLFFAGPKLILVISSRDYKKVAKEQNRNIHCKIVGKIKKHHSQNVVASITSPHKTEDEIIISAHYDSYPGSVGADDNASGVGALIELSKYFLQQKDNLTTNIKFVAFGGEEKAGLGSRAYVNAHKDDIANCKLLFNMDQIGGKNIFVGTTGGVQGIPDTIGESHLPEYMKNRSWEGIESNWRIIAPEAIPILSISNKPIWLEEIIRKSAEELFSHVKFVGNTGSDETFFAEVGIVSTAIGTSGNQYHSPLDVPSQIYKQSLEDCGKIVAKVVLKTMKKNHELNTSRAQLIDKEKHELMAHIKFLASDELKGRKPGTNETKIAARYIAEQFRASGLKNFPSLNGYLQPAKLLIDDNNKKGLQNIKPVLCNNVVGYIEGSDSTLKNEYILLMAHYDHLGIKKDGLLPNPDSIYNGARDNAMGVTALLYAAEQLSTMELKRSIIFLATTGEEEGMLGSKYFVKHSPVPLKDIVFVLNNDGGGYNDTTIIRIGGKNRISYPFALWTEIDKLGIKSLPYPKEFEYLYELGDNITFAKKGIPSITVSPGFDKIDNNLMKYVHQPCDEADDSFNYPYLLKFSFVYSEIAILIANSDNVPKWKDDINN